jgi:hypothetical protein
MPNGHRWGMQFRFNIILTFEGGPARRRLRPLQRESGFRMVMTMA